MHYSTHTSHSKTPQDVVQVSRRSGENKSFACTRIQTKELLTCVFLQRHYLPFRDLHLSNGSLCTYWQPVFRRTLQSKRKTATAVTGNIALSLYIQSSRCTAHCYQHYQASAKFLSQVCLTLTSSKRYCLCLTLAATSCVRLRHK